MDRHEAHARERIRRLGRIAAYWELIGANDALIKSPALDVGDHIVAARTAAHTMVMADWAAEQHREFGYDRPFAVGALGGTGRCELTPCSDLDLVFLFDDVLEGNAFLANLSRQVLDTSMFEESCGFRCNAMPFTLEDVPHAEPRQENSFLDLRPVYDPDGLTKRFRERIQAFGDPFQHFLHVRGFWKGRWERAAAECERLDHFDIKNDGLRVLLAGVWTLAGKDFRHSFDVYKTLDKRDLDAYDFLLRIRAFVHLRGRGKKPALGGGNHAEDVLGFDEFASFGELLPPDAGDRERFDFANEVRARLLSARRRVAHFAKGVIERELRRGRRAVAGSPIVYGPGGLRQEAAPGVDANESSRSCAALTLLHASQHYGVPVDPAELQTTFRDAGDWLRAVPELGHLFYEPRGNLAECLEFLSQLDGAEARLFPGYGRFEVSFDQRVLQEQTSLRGALVQEKIRYLEDLVRKGKERRDPGGGRLGPAAPERGGSSLEENFLRDADRAALLSPDDLAAVKLALKTKRLPLTREDLAKRDDATLPWHERYSSGFSDIPVQEYYRVFADEGGFSRESIDMAVYLIEHRRLFKTLAEAGISNVEQVSTLCEQCPDERRMRTLFVFTCADKAKWESQEADPTQWFNIRELYAMAMQRYRPGFDAERNMEQAGYSDDELAVLRGFGPALMSGSYAQYLPRLGAHLLRLVKDPDRARPKVTLLQNGASKIAAVAARDFRGLAATISGAFWRLGATIRQAHFFSAEAHGLAFDFFHFDPDVLAGGTDFQRTVEAAIRDRSNIGDSVEAELPRFSGEVSLVEWNPGMYRLLFETDEEGTGLIYFLTFKIFRYLGGNIFGLRARTNRGRASVSVYHDLPPGLSLETAREIATGFSRPVKSSLAEAGPVGTFGRSFQ